MSHKNVMCWIIKMWIIVKDSSNVFSKLLMVQLDIILGQFPTDVLLYLSQQVSP